MMWTLGIVSAESLESESTPESSSSAMQESGCQSSAYPEGAAGAFLGRLTPVFPFEKSGLLIPLHEGQMLLHSLLLTSWAGGQGTGPVTGWSPGESPEPTARD
ncbi:hypothetical protein SRHO_G00086330 [Serrasalmus rhombeus]